MHIHLFFFKWWKFCIFRTKHNLMLPCEMYDTRTEVIFTRVFCYFPVWLCSKTSYDPVKQVSSQEHHTREIINWIHSLLPQVFIICSFAERIHEALQYTHYQYMISIILWNRTVTQGTVAHCNVFILTKKVTDPHVQPSTQCLNVNNFSQNLFEAANDCNMHKQNAAHTQIWRQ
jgi:hypothetical protein